MIKANTKFNFAIRAKRIKQFKDHPIKGEYKVVESTLPIYPSISNLLFRVETPNENCKKGLHRHPEFYIKSGEIPFTLGSLLFRSKNGLNYFYGRNVQDQKQLKDFIVVEFFEEKSEVIMLIMSNAIGAHEDWNCIINPLENGEYDASVRELFNQMKPIGDQNLIAYLERR